MAQGLEQDRGQELADWLRLAETPGVGPETARKLLAAFGLPHNIFAADFPALRQVVSERVARALLAGPDAAAEALIEKTLLWAAQAPNHVLTLADAAYPQSLLDIADPPLLLYVKGKLSLLTNPALAVVGSRNASAQGITNAEKFSEALSQNGLTIVSGLALGIDAAAHQGGLKGYGSTIAVIGTGADIVYPARNRTLAHQIAGEGCIVSEYALGMPAIAANFPRRNRIISGLARAVLVIEAAAQSGSLITARMAIEQGRDVLAIPGSIHSTLAKGCHQLIKQGAKLVESAEDVMEELRDWRGRIGRPRAALTTPAVSAGGQIEGQGDAKTLPLPVHVLNALGFDPIDADTLALRVGIDAASLNAELLTLELDGLVERMPGGVYRRLAG
jgi:DNA processing protein